MDEPLWNFAFWASMQSIVWNFTPECRCVLSFSHRSLSAYQLCCFFFLFVFNYFQFLPQWHFMPLCLCLLPSFARRERLHCARGLSCSFLHLESESMRSLLLLALFESCKCYSIFNMKPEDLLLSDADIFPVTKRICSLLMQSYVKHHRHDGGLKITCPMFACNICVYPPSTTLIPVQESNICRILILRSMLLINK